MTLHDRRSNEDYAFYETGEQARRLRWLVVPARKLLRRLLGPVWERERALFAAIDADLVRVDERMTVQNEEMKARDEELKETLRDLGERIEALDERLHSTAALVWDQVALARRLAKIEEHLADRESAESQTREPA
jgi:hypothetical protein